MCDFYAELCSQADQIMGTIDKHFENEENKASNLFQVISEGFLSNYLVLVLVFGNSL